jgi:D-glucosaminate-6-phosphate ammonia-lyase
MTVIRYEDLGIKPVINACGKMTLLGATAVEPEVAEAMVLASQHYVNMTDLEEKAGRRIAEITGAEAACLTGGAASGIAIAAAAFIAGTDPARIQALPDSQGMRNEILVQAGHRINFVEMAKIGGGRLVTVGWVNHVAKEQLAAALTADTAGFIYVISHHVVHKGMLSLPACLEICHAKEVPVLVDAAAEEDLRAYVEMGADLVTYSGGKAIGGPSFGFLCGRAKYIEACKAQSWGIARSMKVTKEGAMGLLTALEIYARRDVGVERHRRQAVLSAIVDQLADLPRSRLSIVADEAGRDIQRAELELDESALGFTAFDLIQHLRSGDPAIVTRDHKANLGILAIDPRSLTLEQAPIIARRIREFYASKDANNP